MPAGLTHCSLNVSFVFGDRSLDAALAAAADAGFRTIELLNPFQHPAAQLRARLDELGLHVDLMNAPMGDFAAGDRGFAGDPGRRVAFEEALNVTAAYAQVLRPAKVNVLAGRAVAGFGIPEQLDCLQANLTTATDRLSGLSVRVVTELLNDLDTPGFLLSNLETVTAVLSELDGRVGFQLDVYHLQRSRGNIIPSIRAMASYTAHVQIADAPGRTEPGTGELNIANILDAVHEAGYNGLVGLEYTPTGRDDPFSWMARAGCIPA